MERGNPHLTLLLLVFPRTDILSKPYFLISMERKFATSLAVL
jgi:hypothetical protein